jgi:sulfur dioxygenase
MNQLLFPEVVNNVPIINCESVQKFLQSPDGKTIQIVDVRSQDEFYGELGHIETAQLVTLGLKLTDFLNTYPDKSVPMIFVCRSGVRSAAAALESLRCGFTQVANMSGGMIAWNNLRYHVIRSES